MALSFLVLPTGALSFMSQFAREFVWLYICWFDFVSGVTFSGVVSSESVGMAFNILDPTCRRLTLQHSTVLGTCVCVCQCVLKKKETRRGRFAAIFFSFDLFVLSNKLGHETQTKRFQYCSFLLPPSNAPSLFQSIHPSTPSPVLLQDRYRVHVNPKRHVISCCV
jgi:hypothetical protein